jgi:hypothetical protein
MVIAPSADDAVDLEFSEILAVALVLLVVLAPAHQVLTLSRSRDHDGRL